MDQITPEKLNNTKTEAEKFYKEINSVYCPYLKSDVAFNTKGLEHLKFKGKNKARSALDQYVRLKLLKLAPEIIKRSHTLQEIFYTQKFEKQTINSRWENRLMNVTFYGFVAIINGARIKIIIKEIAGGNKFFWSIIPFWKNKQKNSGENTTNKKILHTGNMEED
ncbi:MAG: hypothetical protein UR94_C0013G0020 [Parcubacteria group bacterium GW2011_GWA2_36_10]|nr:MAG: hypothetical protein UR94_C0013G0020 [Parcubacteria group bacterium GW2011_GWA2_36_10]